MGPVSSAVDLVGAAEVGLRPREVDGLRGSRERRGSPPGRGGRARCAGPARRGARRPGGRRPAPALALALAEVVEAVLVARIEGEGPPVGPGGGFEVARHAPLGRRRYVSQKTSTRAFSVVPSAAARPRGRGRRGRRWWRPARRAWPPASPAPLHARRARLVDADGGSGGQSGELVDAPAGPADLSVSTRSAGPRPKNTSPAAPGSGTTTAHPPHASACPRGGDPHHGARRPGRGATRTRGSGGGRPEDDAQPGPRVATVVAEEAHRPAVDHDRHVEVAVAVVIGEAGASSPRSRWRRGLRSSSPPRRSPARRAPEEEVLHGDEARGIRLLLVRAAVGGKEVEPPVVVEIEEAGAPAMASRAIWPRPVRSAWSTKRRGASGRELHARALVDVEGVLLRDPSGVTKMSRSPSLSKSPMPSPWRRGNRRPRPNG